MLPGGGEIPRLVGFNCAAPFRERLEVKTDAPQAQQERASIVPPPFGSG